MTGTRNLKTWLVVCSLMLVAVAPAAADEDVILNPGTVSGSVSVTGYQITSITVYAIDTVQVYSATTTVSVPAPADHIDYVLTVEGDRDYYVTAKAVVSATDGTQALLPVSGPVTVPIGDNVPLDLSVNPAIISGTISTGSSSDTIQGYNIYASVTVPEFPGYFSVQTLASGLSVPGDIGRNYMLLLAPGVTYSLGAFIYIDGIDNWYYFYDNIATAPAAGVTVDRDYLVDVAAARISGTAVLQGIDVLPSSYMHGFASSPTRYATARIPDTSTGLYTFNVDAGTWRIQPIFYFHLPGALSSLIGCLQHPYSSYIHLGAGDHVTGVDFIVNPGFTGCVAITGL